LTTKTLFPQASTLEPPQISTIMRSWKIFFLLSLVLNLLLVSSIAYITHRLGGLKYMIHRINNRDISGIYEHRKGFLDVLPMVKEAIVFLGDSITEYGQWEEFMQHPKVRNRGIAGDTTPNLLKRLPAITKMQPAKIFLMIGINDFLFFDRHQIIENYRQIVERIKKDSPDTQLYLQSVLPVNPTIRRIEVDNQEIRLLNKGIQDLAAKEQLNYIDLHTLLADEAGNLDKQYTRDGIHLNVSAYTIWKELVRPYVSEK